MNFDEFEQQMHDAWCSKRDIRERLLVMEQAIESIRKRLDREEG